MIVAVPVSEVPDAKPLAVRVSDQLILAVCRLAGSYYAFDSRCPHRGAQLCDGEIVGEVLVCPLHHFKFSLKSGRCVMPKHLKLRSFQVSEEGGELRIELEMQQDTPRPV